MGDLQGSKPRLNPMQSVAKGCTELVEFQTLLMNGIEPSHYP